jgi:hypothetical protein
MTRPESIGALTGFFDPSGAQNNSTKESPTFGPRLSYPLEYGDLSINPQPHIVFQVRDSVFKGAAVRSTLVMYMPPSVKVSYENNYETLELELPQKVEAVQDLIALDGGSTERLKRGATRIGSTLTGTNALAQREIVQGKMVNPHQALMYKGPGFRTFSFEFQLLAQSRAETENIRDIINRFKYFASPDIEGGNAGRNFLTYPENFNIFFHTPSDRFMFKILSCALVNISIDYMGSGVQSFFSNGAPVEIKLSLEFRELAILTKKEIIQGY